mgnify:CR=1 FL=1|tara:strand:- start:774 stop:1052 length:279 start_codon:yes stop_codon:yes gene_type:complete
MTNLFIPGSILQCIDICSLVQVVDDQRLIPFSHQPWVAYLDPGETTLLLDISQQEALMLIGNRIFSFDCQNNELQKHFKQVKINDENEEYVL